MKMPVLTLLRVAALIAAGAITGPVDAQDLKPLIGARVDTEAHLSDAEGITTAVSDLLAPDGALLVLGYHRCTNICGVLQSNLAETLADLAKPPRVLFVTLDPEEGPQDARAMRAKLHEAVPSADLSEWRFLTGAAPALAAITAPLQMQTYVRPGGAVLVHPVATAILTPDGALSEVFFGFDFTAASIETALKKAANGDTGGLRERIVLFCSGIDTAVGRIARTAWGGIRFAAIAMLILIGGGVIMLLRRENR